MTRASYKIGIDANRPLDPAGGKPAPQAADPKILTDTGAGWVRLNFALAPWASPHDDTPHDGRTWLQAYRAIVTGLRDQGVRIYGLISHEAVAAELGDDLRHPPPEDAPDQPWLRAYVAAFAEIVQLFHDDVQIFESFNEPDDWHASNSNWIHPGWCAIMLQQIYDAVRAQPEMNAVRLISGPLQGLAINNNAAVIYLQTVYREGKRRYSWGQGGRAFPFDGVGYHLYVVEEYDAGLSPQEAQEQLRAAYERYIKELRGVIREHESRDKPIYISEIGWRTNRNPEEFQAERLQLALETVLADPAVALGVWFCLQDFGPPDGNTYYGLYRPGALDAATRKPAYAAFQEVCARRLPAPDEGAFDNRTLIRAVTLTAGELGVERYPLIERGELWDAFLARAAPYRGRPVGSLPGLSQAEQDIIAAKLTALRTGSAPRRGEVTADTLNLRAGPSADEAILDRLSANAPVLVLQEQGAWLRVEANGREGFVSRAFVAVQDEQLPAGFLQNRPALQAITLSPPVSKLFDAFTVQTPSERRLAYIWNRCGRLLAVLADELHIAPALAAAVAAVESGGYAFAADGRLIIRFENHLFLHHWGRAHRELFDQHFAFDTQTSWQGHRWRPSPDGAWQAQHLALHDLDANQQAEWETFLFAATLDAHAARLSISMGAPQILGSNHAVVGYESVEQMFDAFAGGERAQFVALFDFVKASPERVAALQRQDYLTFAALYNGPGQSAVYAALIEAQVQTFDQVAARQAEAISFDAGAGGQANYAIDMAGVSFLPPFWPAPLLAQPPTSGAQQDEPSGGSRGPVPATRAKEKHMPDDPLYKAWQEHIVQGLANNNIMFRRTLRAYLIPYYLTVGMYVGLFLAGLGLFVAAAQLGARQGANLSSMVFAGLGVATFLALFVRNPLRSMEENLQFITWLSIVYNTYWTRLLYMQDPETVHIELEDATGDAIREIEHMIDKNVKLAAKRPGANVDG